MATNRKNDQRETRTVLLSEDEIAAFTSARGRKATDSEYLAEVTEAMKNPTVLGPNGLESGDVHAVRLTETVKGPWVAAQLRKAAKQLGISNRITVWDRSNSRTNSFPHGAIAYFVTPEVTESESESETK